jgi:predicted glycogen debranching enzyme
MQRLIDRVCRPLRGEVSAEQQVDTEWLVTNGLGGYASGTIAGVATRRYHGLLVAALANPLGRVVMLNHLGERVVFANGTSTHLGGEERVAGRLDPDVARHLGEFRLDAGLPVWRYRIDGAEVEKRIYMPYRQNTVFVTYALLSGVPSVQLELHPAVHFRSYEAPVNAPLQPRYTLSKSGAYHYLSTEGPYPPLRLVVSGGDEHFVADERLTSEFLYPVEEMRGYEFRGSLWVPGHFVVELVAGHPVTLVASTEEERVMSALKPNDAQSFERERRRRLLQMAHPALQEPIAAELVLAADQFVFTPVGRVVDTARANATGDEIRSVIAGYHWFTDWGRDTMISLEGLTLSTGRWREAGFILRTFAQYVKDGLIPNMFPDGSNEGLYHTADATLWFFHAVERYVATTNDRATLLQLLPTLEAIVDHHVRGTGYGIGVDPADGLLRQGAEGYQLTWMDAKVDGWVVTPRRGKAVEINALWYNALRLLEGWLKEERGAAASERVAALAERARVSFNQRFWMQERGYLYDVIDGEQGHSAECRPNQLFAISLDHPVLDPERWQPVLDVVQERLLTPVGLRSLAPEEPEYKKKYYGDLRARDAAYHQGTVWGWLIGPWIDAWLRVHPGDRAGARRYLDGCFSALDDFGIGTIGEIFDAEPPYTARGCIAQAWSVAEVLRCLVKTSESGD